MKKVLIGAMIIMSIGAIGCNTKQPTPTTKSGTSWEQVEKEIFTGHMGLMEVQDRVEKSNFDEATKEDIKAIAYELIQYKGMVDHAKIKEEGKKIWELREKNPESFLYDYETLDK